MTVDSDVETATTAEAAETVQSTMAATGLTPGRYQELLSKGAERIDRAIRRLIAAGSYDALRKRSEAARQAAFQVATRLENVSPPTEAEEGHAAHVAALKSLATSLSKTTDAIEAQSVCAAPALRARLGSLVAADDLKRARRALKKAGFEMPLLVPPPSSETDRSLQNGEYVVAADRSGYGQLTIENGRVIDSVVAVVPEGARAPVLAVYVQAKSTFTATGIPDGTYEVAFTQGNDWDPGLGRFTKKCDFTKFDEPFPYTTSADTYRVWTVSLQPVAGGTASTSPTRPDDFPPVGQT